MSVTHQVSTVPWGRCDDSDTSSRDTVCTCYRKDEAVCMGTTSKSEGEEQQEGFVVHLEIRPDGF